MADEAASELPAWIARRVAEADARAAIANERLRLELLFMVFVDIPLIPPMPAVSRRGSIQTITTTGGHCDESR